MEGNVIVPYVTCIWAAVVQRAGVVVVVVWIFPVLSLSFGKEEDEEDDKENCKNCNKDAVIAEAAGTELLCS